MRNTHIKASRETVENYKLAYQIYNPAYTEVRRLNIWAQAIEQVCVNNTPVDIAVDNAIESNQSSKSGKDHENITNVLRRDSNYLINYNELHRSHNIFL